MSIFRSVLVAGLLSATALYAQSGLTDDAYVDDFDDLLEGASGNQTSLGEVFGFELYNSKPWLGDGWYYTFKDAGCSVTNGDGEEVTALENNEATMVVDGALHVNLITSTGTGDNPYAGVGAAMVGPDEGYYIDLSKATSVTVRVKGSGSARMHFETQDIADMGVTWGWYGYVLDLTSEWTEITIPVADLEPEPYSEPALADMTWTGTGAQAVNKISFQAKNGDDAELYVDYIKLDGMTYEDIISQLRTPVVAPMANNKVANIFSVSNSAVSFKLAKADHLNVTLNNLKGETVRSLYTGKTAAHTINLGNLNLANGQYMVVINGKNAKYTQPITIAK